MKRLFFLVPDLKETSNIAHELEEIGVNNHNIHICGGLPEDLEDEHLHRANLLQTTHLGKALKRGPLIGLGFFALIVALFLIVLPANVTITAFGYIAMLIFGVVIGVWTSGLIGIGVKNDVVEKYEKYVEDGHYIMMIDIPPEREKELKRIVFDHHPGARMAEDVLH